MCGIVGVANWSGEPVAPELIARMVSAVRHRGPDDENALVEENIGLGHARLSIIDLVAGGQPMANEDRSIWVVFNGEIFNYLELRRDLERRGHRFTTNSDTEVILHAYEESGERCVEDFNGQWAFAIWDKRNRRLFLSRDRLGVRPLFFTAVGSTFLFASEIKSLFRHPAVPRRLDPQGLDETFTFWTVLAPRTAFAGISELPPAHSMVVTADGVTMSRYWDLRYEPESPPQTQSDYEDELEELLSDATRLRLRSDVPVGSYLSGGLDSTIVTGLIKRCSTAPLKTFSVTFDQPEFDERAHQLKAVRHYQTDHCELRCSNEQIGRVFPDVVWHAEKPLLRSAPAPLFLLAGLVRRNGYKVVLTGEGSDEVMGGYDLFKEAKIRRFWAMRPESRLRPMLLRRLYPYMPQMQSQSPDYLRAFFRVRAEDCASPFFSHLPRWTSTARAKQFFSREFRAQVADFDGQADFRAVLPDEFFDWNNFSQSEYLEATSLLPGYILSSQGDRVAMAHGVEARYPFLDHRVVEFAARLPVSLKMKGLQEKYLLKKSFGSLVPESIRNRTKQPYRAPDASSFFGGPDKPIRHEYLDDLLAPDRLRLDGVFAPEPVLRLVKKARAGHAVGAADNMALIGIISTQLLVHKFIRNPQ